MSNRIGCLLTLLVLLAASASASAQHSLQDLLAAGEEAKLLAGEWAAVEGTQAGNVLTKEQLAKVAFTTKGGYALELGPLVPRGDWPTGYLCTLSPAAKQVTFSRNVGKAVDYYGTYEIKDDTLRLSLQLLPWERTTGDPSYGPNSWTFKADTVLTFQKVKK